MRAEDPRIEDSDTTQRDSVYLSERNAVKLTFGGKGVPEGAIGIRVFSTESPNTVAATITGLANQIIAKSGVDEEKSSRRSGKRAQSGSAANDLADRPSLTTPKLLTASTIVDLEVIGNFTDYPNDAGSEIVKVTLADSNDEVTGQPSIEVRARNPGKVWLRISVNEKLVRELLVVVEPRLQCENVETVELVALLEDTFVNG
jgi:hypothetical protein